jgi:DNA-binding transcriptional LysR family regulator
LNFDALDSFVKIAELRSISAAAKLYGVPKSTLSLRLKQLEADVKAALFVREGHSLILTEAGGTLLNHAQEILERCETARVAVADTIDDASGTLRIGATGEFGTAFYAQMLHAFRERYPKVQLELVFFSPHGLYLQDRHESLDAIISWDEGNTTSGPSEPLWRDRFALFASQSYLDRMGLPQNPQDLARHSGILFKTPVGPQVWRLQNGAEQASILPRSDLVTNDYWTVKYFAVAGEGIAYLPKFFVALECEFGHLTALMPDWESADQRVTIRILRPNAQSRRMSAFIAFARDYFSPDFAFGGPRYFVESVVKPDRARLEKTNETA